MIYLKLTSCKKRNTKKASQINDVPINYIKEFRDFFTPVIPENYNDCLDIGIFPECFKTAYFSGMF